MSRHEIIPIDLSAAFGGTQHTFGSLPQWFSLGGHCSNCEREGWVDRWSLQARYGADMPIQQLRPALRCLKCGNKGSNTWTVGKLPR